MYPLIPEHLNYSFNECQAMQKAAEAILEIEKGRQAHAQMYSAFKAFEAERVVLAQLQAQRLAQVQIAASGLFPDFGKHPSITNALSCRTNTCTPAAASELTDEQVTRSVVNAMREAGDHEQANRIETGETMLSVDRQTRIVKGRLCNVITVTHYSFSPDSQVH